MLIIYNYTLKTCILKWKWLNVKKIEEYLHSHKNIKKYRSCKVYTVMKHISNERQQQIMQIIFGIWWSICRPVDVVAEVVSETVGPILALVVLGLESWSWSQGLKGGVRALGVIWVGGGWGRGGCRRAIVWVLNGHRGWYGGHQGGLGADPDGGAPGESL